MKYKKLGRTGLLVSELCFGTMTFGGGEGMWKAMGEVGQKAADRLIGKVLDAGINFIDTADMYADGEAESILGAAIKHRRKEVVLATKVYGRMGEGPNDVGLSRHHIMDAVDASLARLQTDYIDLYQIHGFDPLTPLDETLRALDDLVRWGKVRYIGCSNMAAWQLMKSLWTSDVKDLARFESLQAYYTVAGRDLERELVPLLLDQDMGLMVWSPLAGGLLSGKYDREGNGPNGARRQDFNFPPVDLDRAFEVLPVMGKIAGELGTSVACVAMAWLLHQKAVTSVIVGARTYEQLEENIKAPGIALPDEAIAELNRVSALPEEYPGWMLTRQSGYRIP